MSQRISSQHQPPLLGNRSPRKTIPLIGVLILVLLAGLLCAILGVVAALLFPREIRVAIGLPEATMGLPSQQSVTNSATPFLKQPAINIELTEKALGLTQTAIVNNATTPKQPPIALATPYPTYTAMPTYTPYPNRIVPTINNTPTATLEPNLLYFDNFDNEINPKYWQQFGKWMVANGVPVIVEAYKPGDKFKYSAFALSGGLIFPSASQLDNIVIEFDWMDPDYIHNSKLYILLSYKDEYNYKSVEVNLDYHANSLYPSIYELSGFYFVANEKRIEIPQSRKDFLPTNSYHFRIGIRGNSLIINVNGQTLYNFKNLPEPITGAIGFATLMGKNSIDNFKIYQLP